MYERTPEIRDKISASVTRLHFDRPDYTKGCWVHSFKADRDVFVRSSWETRVLRILDRHPRVEEVAVEPLVIPYEFEGSWHRYIPDLLVIFEGGIRELWEVKPKEFVNWPINQAKFEALNRYVLAHGMNAAIVTLANIEALEHQFNLPERA